MKLNKDDTSQASEFISNNRDKLVKNSELKHLQTLINFLNKTFTLAVDFSQQEEEKSNLSNGSLKRALKACSLKDEDSSGIDKNLMTNLIMNVSPDITYTKEAIMSPLCQSYFALSSVHLLTTDWKIKSFEYDRFKSIYGNIYTKMNESNNSSKDDIVPRLKSCISSLRNQATDLQIGAITSSSFMRFFILCLSATKKEKLKEFNDVFCAIAPSPRNITLSSATKLFDNSNQRGHGESPALRNSPPIPLGQTSE